MKAREVLLNQTDEKLMQLGMVKDIIIPRSGWIHAIRKSLKISLKQLGQKMKMTPQSVKDLEEREKNGTASIGALRKFADAMGMKFVYGFIPAEGTLEKMIEKRALEIATGIIRKTGQNMELEAQGLSEEQLQIRVKEKRDEIINNMPGYLWD